MQEIARDGPKWGRELFFPTNPDLFNILGDTDFFGAFYFWDLFFDPTFPRFWSEKKPKLPQ